MPRMLAVLLTTLALLWSVLLFAAAAGLDRGSPGAAVGSAILYASASRICHQRPERSFSLAGTQLPVCARCAGLYLSGALGVLVAWAPFRGRSASTDRLMLVACAIPTAATWSLEVAGIAVFSNAVRALAAVPLGAAAGWVFVRALRDEARTGRAAPAGIRPRALS